MLRTYQVAICSLMSLTFACQSDNVDHVNEKEKGTPGIYEQPYCDNQLRLITTADTLKAIEIDISQPPDSIMSLIEYSLKQDVCDRVVYFGLYYDTKAKQTERSRYSIPLLVRVHKSCGERRYITDVPRITILMNEKEQLLIQNRYGTKDSIIPWISHHYFNSKDPLIVNGQIAFINLYWDEPIDKDFLADAFSFIIDGYLSATNQFSQQLFNVEVCDLTSVQVDTLISQMPFNFEIAFGIHNLERFTVPNPRPNVLSKNSPLNFRGLQGRSVARLGPASNPFYQDLKHLFELKSIIQSSN